MDSLKPPSPKNWQANKLTIKSTKESIGLRALILLWRWQHFHSSAKAPPKRKWRWIKKIEREQNKKYTQQKEERKKRNLWSFYRRDSPRRARRKKDKTPGSNPGAKTTKETSVLKAKAIRSPLLGALFVCFATPNQLVGRKKRYEKIGFLLWTYTTNP